MKKDENDRVFYFENNFYLTSKKDRLAKVLSHYEIYKKIIDLPGEIIECGIFKGASLSRLIMFRDLLESSNSRNIIGFDTFEDFPETNYEKDKIKRNDFIDKAGKKSIPLKKLKENLYQRNLYENVRLIKGDIIETIPKFVKENPELKIALINLDTDIYEPAEIILKYLYPHLVKGGIIMFDDYGVFPGETKAIDEFFKNKNELIKKVNLNKTPSYIIKK